MITQTARALAGLLACMAGHWPLAAQPGGFQLMFYNLENYYDTRDDPATDDDDFTPEGRYHWTRARFKAKRDGICKAIVAAGGGRMPDVIGLCEVENRYVLQQLTEASPLARLGYAIVHRDSPDARGIDVALLYRRESFKVLRTRFQRMDNERTRFKSREILYVKGVTKGGDTLHLLVNHWPSKRGGAERSAPRRMAAARAARTLVDSILAERADAAVCIMGDFNDYPDSRPMVQGLGTATKWDPIVNKRLYNLALPLAAKGAGSLKYRNRWELIDQFIVSGGLLNNNRGRLRCDPDGMVVFKHPMLLEATSGKGHAPKRTYKGLRYNGGVSDHLPVGLLLRAGD